MMKISRTFMTLVVLCALVLGAALTATGTRAQSANTVTIMVGGLNKQIYLAAKLTDQLGYFKDEGLDMHLLDEPAGVNAEDDMLAGKVDGVVGFYDHNIDLQAKGKDTEARVQLAWGPCEVGLAS